MTEHSKDEVSGTDLEPSKSKPALRVENVSHGFGKNQVLDSVSFSVASGEIVCLLGASGSGKSTLLRIVAGLESLQAGKVHIEGVSSAEPGNEPPPESRGCGFVFQDHVLFPHLTARENVEFGLTSLTAADRRERAEKLLEEVGLLAHVGSYPHTLSGGEQQRVAIARALAPRPRVMLLDEPFASVDSTLRRRLREDTRLALRSSGVPSILVTHDATEAMELADRIVVIHDGRIAQDANPETTWRSPANVFIAELVCDTSAIQGTGVEEGVLTVFGVVEVQNQTIESGKSYAVVVRSDAVALSVSESSSTTVADVRFLGDRHVVTLANENHRLRVSHSNPHNFAVGDSVSVSFDAHSVLVYPNNDNEYH